MTCQRGGKDRERTGGPDQGAHRLDTTAGISPRWRTRARIALCAGLCAGLLYALARASNVAVGTIALAGPAGRVMAGASSSGAGGARDAGRSDAGRSGAGGSGAGGSGAGRSGGGDVTGAGSTGAARSALSPARAPLPLSRDQVIAHIKRTLDWYNQAQGIEQLPELSGDVVSRDRLREESLTTVRLAFEFGRAAVVPLAAGGPKGGPRTSAAGMAKSGAPGASGASAAATGVPPRRSLDQASARITSRIAALRSQVSGLDARLARASTRTRARLRARRNQVAAALGLEQEALTTVNELRRFQSFMLVSQAPGAKDLLGQITDLERSVPEVWQHAQSAEHRTPAELGAAPQGATGTAGTAAPVGAAPGAVSGTATAYTRAGSFHPESAGIIALIGQWIAMKSADGQLGGMLGATNGLRKELDGLRSPLVAQARALLRTDTSGLDSTDSVQLDASRRSLEAAAVRFRQLAALLVPLGDQEFALDSANAALGQWRDALRSRMATTARYLVTHVVILVALVLAVLVISEVWRRAVFKYLQDSRRRSQFQTLRRVVVGIALAVVVVFALVSQLGSLATYVGFLTAGLAVALQTVILSIVAYFFFIGRYGVRVGDRITLAGVTGRVADIGLIRIYLMELAGADLHSTGRIVVLSNSVLFQPQALFKQIPGADYLWHTIALTLAPSVDVQAAQQHLQSTADDVYQHYRPAIEAQHAAMRRLVDFDTAVPCPEVRVRYAEQGWQFDVRYPVQAEQAARIDQKMLKSVRDALAGAAQLPVAASGEPVLKAAET